MFEMSNEDTNVLASEDNRNQVKQLNRRENSVKNSPLTSRAGRKGSARTPSGTIINTPVSDIRKFYQPVSENKDAPVVKDREKIYQHDKLLEPVPIQESWSDAQADPHIHKTIAFMHDWLPLTTNESNKTLINTYELQSVSECEKNFQKIKKRKQTEMDNTDELDVNGVNGDTNMDHSQDSFDEEGELRIDCEKNNKRSKTDVSPSLINTPSEEMKQILEDLAVKESQGDTPQVLDIRTVMQMFEKIKSEIATIKTKQKEESEPQTEMERSIRRNLEEDFNRSIVTQEQRIDQLEKKLNDATRKSKLYEDVIQYNAALMDDITKRLNKIELSNARKTAVITGITTSMKKKDCKTQIIEFIDTNVVENPEVDDVYKLNADPNGPTVVVFSSIFKKERVFQQKNKLKDLNIENQGPVYLNNYLTGEENEKRKRERIETLQVQRYKVF